MAADLFRKDLFKTNDNSNRLRKKTDANIEVDSTGYRQLIGKLLYLTFTKPNITYFVQVLSQFMDQPTEEHLLTAHGALKHLKSAPGQGILMDAYSDLKITAYCDNDWAGCPDSRKSVTGYSIFFFGNFLVNWKSKKQSVVARSFTEAEYRSMESACCEVIGLKNLLADFGLNQGITVRLYFDN
ncbi:Cysteine-rich RLK (RECEPTOR-like protein kinase) 8 [Theobroma cacao]|uniref:Cysteine-rich RLK (RECEPTOR-like protein kinase) 8 n=1 Tax=Theobroma cacao TaxID=3641 RepID=A0A061F184_THECC|nr:Cysteine-rich RLK (RECEPTOR-like protein kinase) 8 [Theobroma cacao]